MLSSIQGSTAALQGLIKRDQSDLNDWVSCVSAKTPKGKSEIQKISGEISAAKEQIARIQQTHAGGVANAKPDPSQAGGSGALLNVWA